MSETTRYGVTGIEFPFWARLILEITMQNEALMRQQYLRHEQQLRLRDGTIRKQQEEIRELKATLAEER